MWLRPATSPTWTRPARRPAGGNRALGGDRELTSSFPRKAGIQGNLLPLALAPAPCSLPGQAPRGRRIVWLGANNGVAAHRSRQAHRQREGLARYLRGTASRFG